MSDTYSFGIPSYDPNVLKQKQTGGNDLAIAAEDTINEGSKYALGLSDVENQRHEQMRKIVEDALGKASGPAWTEADMRNAYGNNADEAAASYKSNIGNLNDILGSSGQTGGGMGAALAANYDLSRMGQILSANRASQLEAVKMNTEKKMRDFNNTLALAETTGQSPSAIGMDWLQNILDVRLQQNSANRADENAKSLAKAQKQKGWQDLIGNVVGIGVGALL